MYDDLFENGKIKKIEFPIKLTREKAEILGVRVLARAIGIIDRAETPSELTEGVWLRNEAEAYLRGVRHELGLSWFGYRRYING